MRIHTIRLFENFIKDHKKCLKEARTKKPGTYTSIGIIPHSSN